MLWEQFLHDHDAKTMRQEIAADTKLTKKRGHSEILLGTSLTFGFAMMNCSAEVDLGKIYTVTNILKVDA